MSSEREPGDRAFWDAERREHGEGAPASSGEAAPEPKENPLMSWARALAMGVRDTARDVLDEGRSGARAKQAQMWERFDRKTKGRRTREQ